MKKTYIIYSMIAIAAVMACNKVETNEQPLSTEEEKGYDVIYATTEATKTTIAGTGINERVEWVKGDEVAVYDKNYNKKIYIAQKSGNPVPFTCENGLSTYYAAVYPVSSAIKCEWGPKITVNVPERQNGQFKNHVYIGRPSSTSSNDFLFESVTSVIKITVPAERQIETITLESTNDICGNYIIDYYNNTKSISSGAKKIIVTASPGTTLSGSVYIAVLPCAKTSNITVNFLSADRFAAISQSSVVPFKVNTIEDFGVVKVDLNKYPKAFTIDDAGHQVFFASGNLQYQAKGTDGKSHWRFAEHQWDYVGYGQDNVTAGTIYVNGVKSTNCDTDVKYSEYSGWIDYFGFGTSGCEGGPAPYLSTADESLYPNVNLAQTVNHKYDWGRYCDIESKNTDGTWSLDQYNKEWYTISREQWAYIFGRSGEKWGIAKISSVQVDGTAINKAISGTIILPDYFDQPDVKFTPGQQTLNEYTLEQFQLMENNGAIFLPWGGFRSNGLAGLQIGVYGRYNTTERGKQIDFLSTTFGWSTSGSFSSFGGSLVRLVRDVPAE